MTLDDRSAFSPLVDRLRDRFGDGLRLPWTTEDDRPQLTMPATSIYSRTDGVVRAEAWSER